MCGNSCFLLIDSKRSETLPAVSEDPRRELRPRVEQSEKAMDFAVPPDQVDEQIAAGDEIEAGERSVGQQARLVKTNASQLARPDAASPW
jgi:hypothetical protein